MEMERKVREFLRTTYAVTDSEYVMAMHGAQFTPGQLAKGYNVVTARMKKGTETQMTKTSQVDVKRNYEMKKFIAISEPDLRQQVESTWNLRPEECSFNELWRNTPWQVKTLSGRLRGGMMK
jgi:hypothetical protein